MDETREVRPCQKTHEQHVHHVILREPPATEESLSFPESAMDIRNGFPPSRERRAGASSPAMPGGTSRFSRSIAVWWLMLLCSTLALGGAVGTPARASAMPQVSYDIVPRGSWTYDALAWLAKRGKMKPYTARDFLVSRLYTRMEIADMLRDLKVVNGHTWDGYTPEEREVLRQLADEYRPELQFLTVDMASFTDGLDKAAPNASIANAWAYGDSTRQGSRTTTRGVISLDGLGMQGQSTVFGATLTNDARLFHPTDYHPFQALDHFFWEHRGKEWNWEVGRSYSWIGTAGTGSMWLGDASPALYLGRAEKTFGLGRVLGAWRLSWQVGGWSESGQTLYLVSKRAEKTISRQWSVGLIDMAKTFDTPNPLMLVLPSLAYQSKFLKQVDTKFNVVEGIEGIYHPNSHIDAYAQWLVDDISNPFQPSPNTPTKTGKLIGFRLRSGEPMDAGTRLQVEYAIIDNQTYDATRPGFPLLAWTQDGLPLAWPYGPNSDTLSVRSEQKLGEHVDLVASLVDSRQKLGPGKQQIWSMLPTYNFTPSTSLGVLLERETGDTQQNVLGVQGMVVF